MKRKISDFLSFLVCANTALFLFLAYLHRLPTGPKAAIFIDFWGRFCVYSLWFIGYVLYRKYLLNHALARRAIIFVVCANIPFFLLLAFFDKLVMNEENIVFVDFWGRLTVYSFWVICYETYRTYFGDDSKVKTGP